MTTIDVEKVSAKSVHEIDLGSGKKIDLGTVMNDAFRAVSLLISLGRFRYSASMHSSIGVAMTKPIPSGGFPNWDDPYELGWFVDGWGPCANQGVANALRKLRPLVRWASFLSTRDMLLGGWNEPLETVRSIEADGTFAWGDFSYAGATYVHVGSIGFWFALSGLKQLNDHTAALMIGDMIATEIIEGLELLG